MVHGKDIIMRDFPLLGEFIMRGSTKKSSVQNISVVHTKIARAAANGPL